MPSSRDLLGFGAGRSREARAEGVLMRVRARVRRAVLAVRECGSGLIDSGRVCAVGRARLPMGGRRQR